MSFFSRSRGTALSIAALAAVALTSPVRAQEDPGAAAPQTAPLAAPAKPADTPRRLARPRAGGSAVASARLNLRSGPGTDSEILTTIPAGTPVGVGECEGEWCAVTWNGQSGYAIKRNLGLGGPRQAGGYPGQPGNEGGYPPQPGYPAQSPYPAQPGGYPATAGGPPAYPPPGPAYAPGYAYGPPVAYGPAYYGPRVYYAPGWGWRRGWW